MIQNLGAANGFTVVTTEDAALFNDANLAQYGAVIWLSTTGDVLDPAQQAAFTRFIQMGRGYVGIHSASDTEYTWPWYGVLVGGYFNGHPTGGQQSFPIEDATHPSTTGLPNPWIRSEAEWYDFNPNPRTNSRILVRYTEPATHPAPMGDHPMSWCKPYDGGRSWYTAFGHNDEAYSEPAFQQHVLGGIRWALGAVSGNCGTAPPTPAPRTTATATPTGGNTCSATNLALFRPATGSSALSSAGLAFDGDLTTRWESAHGVDPDSHDGDARARHSAVAGPSGDGVVDGERGLARERGGRREHGHAVVVGVLRSAVDLRRSRFDALDQPRRPDVGSRVRNGVPDPDVERRRQLDADLLDDDRQRRDGRSHAFRQRALRANERNGARDRVRLFTLGVPGVRTVVAYGTGGS
jgi:type 1 glutamine amidotransferase